MAFFDPLTSDYASQLLTTIGKQLYLNSELADVHFVIESDGDSERVPAHKTLLMAASDVFATMFNGTWKEKNEVDISDTSPAAFKQFLQFFYLNQVKLTMDDVDAVMDLGEKYNLAECLAVCSKFVKNNLNDDNVCRFYGLAILYNQKELQRSCETVFGLNTKVTVKSPGFLSCDKKVLAEILKLNGLSCGEVELFEACMSWVKAKSKQNILTKEHIQAQLGDSFYKIRFGSLSLQEFAALIPTYGQFFTTVEYADIIQMISNKEFRSALFNGKRTIRYEENVWEYNELILCKRLLSKRTAKQPYFIKDLEITKFSVNEPLLLNGFEVSHIWEYRDNNFFECEDVPTEVTLVEISSSGDFTKEVVLDRTRSKLENSDSNSISTLKPILVRPGLIYEIRLMQNPPKNCAIDVILKSKVQMEDDIIVQFYDNSSEIFPQTGIVFDMNFYRIGK